MEPATATLVAAAIQAAGSVGGGILANKGAGKETKIQRKKRKLIDQLLAGLETGQGPYANLFAQDENAFQKSFVDPAKAIYKNQIAPQIQQSYLATGQQRGTGMEDQLLRAGVDLDQMLNQQYMNFQNQGKDRMSQMINSILGADAGPQPALSTGEAAAQGGAGFLASDAFGNTIKDLAKTPAAPAPATPAAQGYAPPRKGFEPNWRDVQFAQR
jgi:hypothetical protein